MDTIRATFLGDTTGIERNRITLEKARNRFNAVFQGRTMQTSIFLELHTQELQVLEKQELDSGTLQEEFDVMWSVPRVIDHIIHRLDDSRFAMWKHEMQYDSGNHPTPETLEELYKAAVIKEERQRSQQRWQNFERANMFLSREKKVKQGDTKKKEGPPDDDRIRDSRGNLCCFDHIKGMCSYGEKCRYSHNAPVGQKSKPGAKDLDAMVDRAVGKKVTFPDDTRAGGGPDPAKFSGKN